MTVEPPDPLPSASRRALLAAVLESLAGSDLEAVAARHGVDPAALSAAREAFVAAGAGALDALARTGGWTQVAVALEPGGPGPADLLGGEAVDRLAAWLDGGADRRFFFMLKRPGARLRFAGLDERCRRELLGALGERTGADDWTLTPYDAEIAQFGGATGLDLAHRHFTIESLAVLDYQRLRRAGTARLSPSELSLMLLDRVIRSTVDDAWEAWDVWAKMALTGRVDGMPSAADPPGRHAQTARRTRALLERQDDRLERASAEERALFARYSAALAPLAADVRAAVDAGALLWGLREILPFWVVFHWNRMGFTPERQAALTRLMWWTWSPKQEPA